jgi:hypothetical protein
MATLPEVKKGGIIQSAAWNDMVREVNGKVNRATDIMTGPLTVNSNVAVGGSLGFGEKGGQLINLWRAEYGLGVQDSTTYFRTNVNFGWYKGGGHNDATLNPGKDGTMQMSINADGDLSVRRNLQIGGNWEIGNRVGQLINAWDKQFGMGIQQDTLYFRSNTNFAWHRAGAHNDGALNSGLGGALLMSLRADGALHVSGDLNVGKNLQVLGNWELGNRVGQVINAWDKQFGMGIQTNTLYFRSNTNFAWHRGGVHDNGEINPGGGALLMSLKGDGNLRFGARDGGGQMLNFWKEEYGIGVQDNTLYHRSNAKFYWYTGGSHDRTAHQTSGGGTEQMSLHEDGNLLIRGTLGKVSDKRLKKNIKDIEGALGKLTQLRGVTFQWKDTEANRKPENTQIGMIAQEVELVFPDWVKTYGENKTLTISGFEALVIESLKELKAEIEKIKTHLKI